MVQHTWPRTRVYIGVFAFDVFGSSYSPPSDSPPATLSLNIYIYIYRTISDGFYFLRILGNAASATVLHDKRHGPAHCRLSSGMVEVKVVTAEFASAALEMICGFLNQHIVTSFQLKKLARPSSALKPRVTCVIRKRGANGTIATRWAAVASIISGLRSTAFGRLALVSASLLLRAHLRRLFIKLGVNIVEQQ